MARRIRLAPKRRIAVVRLVRRRVVLPEPSIANHVTEEDGSHITFEDGKRIKKEEAD